MYINLHTHHCTKTKQGIELVNCAIPTPTGQLPPYFSSGIHPWDIKNSVDTDVQKLKELANNKRLLAIGECGLDKLKGPDLVVQTKGFTAQIELSEKLQLPLIIHCVKTHSEIIKLRKDIQPKQAWIFHGFNASKETMQQALKHGFYFSFGEQILNKRSKANQVLPFIPHNKLFLETDDNPQLNIESVYNKASQLLNLEPSQLELIIQDNFKQLFNVNI